MSALTYGDIFHGTDAVKAIYAKSGDDEQNIKWMDKHPLQTLAWQGLYSSHLWKGSVLWSTF